VARRTTSIRLSASDAKAARAVRDRWGLPSLNAAIGFALRVVARAERVTVQPGPEQEKGKMLVVRLDEQADEAMRTVRRRWECPSDSAAIVFALRALAQAERLEIVPATRP
jgi:hypothetical protein